MMTNSELNTWTATHIKHWHFVEGDWCDPTGKPMCPDWAWTPTDDIKQAWELLEQLFLKESWEFIVENTETNEYRVSIWPKAEHPIAGHATAEDASTPRAICLAIKAASELREQK